MGDRDIEFILIVYAGYAFISILILLVFLTVHQVLSFYFCPGSNREPNTGIFFSFLPTLSKNHCISCSDLKTKTSKTFKDKFPCGY